MTPQPDQTAQGCTYVFFMDYYMNCFATVLLNNVQEMDCTVASESKSLLDPYIVCFYFLVEISAAYKEGTTSINAL